MKQKCSAVTVFSITVSLLISIIFKAGGSMPKYNLFLVKRMIGQLGKIGIIKGLLIAFLLIASVKLLLVKYESMPADIFLIEHIYYLSLWILNKKYHISFWEN
jgi:hypothetical protein